MMRWIVVVLGLLSISLGFAQDLVPGNVSATAIAQDAFTLIWDGVEGASRYEVEIAEGMYYNFDQDLPSGWIIDNASYSESSNFAHTDPKYLALRLVSSISSPDLGDIREFSFFSGVASQSAKAIVNIEVSSDATEWTQLGQLIRDSNKEDITTTYKEYTYNIEGQGIHYFRINQISGESSAVLIDDLHYTLNEPIEVLNSSAPVLRLDDLSPNTNYTVRVKANTDGAEFSNWLNVTTRPQHTSSAGNSSIAGGAATISLSPNGGTVSHGVTIDPSGEGPYHYTASVESIVGGYQYTIDDGDSGGLAGEYTINHPGFTATDCTVDGGSVAAPNAGAGRSSFNIETVGKGAITITLMGGDTLPVSISAFEISYAAQGVCHVSWASAAESGMLGYYVKCSADSLYEHMSFISSLIPAHNESQPRSYQYIHENPPMPGWYWLVAAFMNGEEDIYGPVTQGMPYDPGVSNPVYQNSVLIYPNPFGSSANLRLNLKKDTQIEYKIYNIKGQLLKSGSLGLLPEGTTRRLMPELSIDGKPLNNGVYLLKLEGAGLDLQTRFVISK